MNTEEIARRCAEKYSDETNIGNLARATLIAIEALEKCRDMKFERETHLAITAVPRLAQEALAKIRGAATSEETKL